MVPRGLPDGGCTLKRNNFLSMLLAEAVASSLARKMAIAGVVSHGLFCLGRRADGYESWSETRVVYAVVAEVDR